MARKWTEEEITGIPSMVRLAKEIGFKVIRETDTEVEDSKGVHPICPILEACEHCKGTSAAARELSREDCRRHHETSGRYLGYKKVICPQQFADRYD